MPYLTWLADVLRDAGLPVREVAGWKARGHGAMGQVQGVLCHHTAGPAKGLYPSENVVVNGRPGLAGPLCNLGLDRAGTWVVVAAGQAWHAGTGSCSFCPAGRGNSQLIGVEAESRGTVDDWTGAQRINYPRGVAALLTHLRLGSYRAIGHKEWAPGRKIDPAFWSMGEFRADVVRWMASSSATVGRHAAPDLLPPSDEEDTVDIPIRPDQSGDFRHAAKVDLGGSVGYTRAWVTLGSTWGDTRFVVTALGPQGVLAQWPITVPNNDHRYVELPPGTHTATFEGSTAVRDTIPVAALWHVR